VSATGRGGQRSPADYYPTPAWCVHRLHEARVLPRGRWLEPSAGEGHIIRASSYLSGIEWTACELRPECEPLLAPLAPVVRIGNFLSADAEWLGLRRDERFAVCIGNPPFRYALEFVDQARRFADVVVLLLRLGFLETEDRAEMLREWTPSVDVLPDRASFDGEGTDSTAYGWFVWDRWHRRPHGELRVLAPTPLEQRRAGKCVLSPPVVEQQDLFAAGGAQ
jgi:hypothetical protein